MNTEESSMLLKAKRDQFLVQIRKKKNEMMIELKRQKLSSDAQRAVDINDPIFQQTNLEIIKQCNELAAAFVDCYKVQDLAKLTEIVQGIRKAISQNSNPPLDSLIATGIIPYIIKLLSYEYFSETHLLIECGWVLTNVASGSVKHVKYLIDSGLADAAIGLLDHPNEDVMDNAVWILANFAGDSIEHRDLLIEKGIVEKIEGTLDGNSFQPVFIGHVAWLISNLCRGKPYPPPEKVVSLMRIVEFFLCNVPNNDECASHSMWALSYFSDGEDIQIKAVLEMKIVDKIIEFVRSKNILLKAPGLRTAGNLVTGKDEYTEIMIKNGIIGALSETLMDEKKIFRKEACWAFSNILAGKSHLIEEVFNYNNREVLKNLFYLIFKDEKDVVRECIFCLSNACSDGSVAQIQILVEQNLIEILVETLKTNNESTILKVSLEAIENILYVGENTYNQDNNPFLIRLAECGGYSVIENLQGHPSNDVYNIVERIITNHMQYHQ